jgi:hypothetical protein
MRGIIRQAVPARGAAFFISHKRSCFRQCRGAFYRRRRTRRLPRGRIHSRRGKSIFVSSRPTWRVLEEKNVCSTAVTGTGGFYRINEVNGYHGFIKGRNRAARGFGTKYLKPVQRTIFAGLSRKRLLSG